jgi:hypothetical protein
MTDTAARPFNTEVKDIRGRRFGRLLVQEFAGINSAGLAAWNCLCDCGKTKILPGAYLTGGRTKSCGCYRQDKARADHTTHGMTHTKEFTIWSGIRERTLNPNYHHFADYGGRGILMCPEWLNSFETFLSDMGDRPSANHSIDRRDNDKGYYKENCRWATGKEQSRNRRDNHLVTYKGETLPLSAWTERLGFRKMTLRNRIVSGWDLERAMTEPEKEKVLRRLRRRTS